MILEILAATLSITSLNSAKPKATWNDNNYTNGTPQIYKATSDEAKDIILNSYYLKIDKTELPYMGDSNEYKDIKLKVYHLPTAPNQPNNTKYYNRVYMLLGGYPYKYQGFTENDNGIADFLTNPAGIWTNDGEYLHCLLNPDDYETMEEDENETTALVTNMDDETSGYNYYGFIVPKEYPESANALSVLIGTKEFIYKSKSYITESNPEGLAEYVKEPQQITYSQYAPFRNKTQNTNYLSRDLNDWPTIDDGQAPSTADENMYYYDCIFNNTWFINSALGLGNYAVNAMYKVYQAGPDYKYQTLSMYKITSAMIEHAGPSYTNILNEYYEEIGGYSKLNKEMILNRITNAEDDRNGNYWKYEKANQFIVLDPNKNYEGITQMQVLEAHMITGEVITADTITIQIDAGIGDVFTLISQCFMGIGGFFTIALIPGITLGTLFFLPFVISLIIWLIHLFKRH